MGIRRHISYGRYLIRHKWYVTVECFRHGLIWRGIVHDLDKFLPWRWIPYANYFHGPDGTNLSRRDETGYYRPVDVRNEAFRTAVNRHTATNDHHWEYWIRDGHTVEMKQSAVKEMICDWRGAGRAQGYKNWRDVRPWFIKNGRKMQFDSSTRMDIVLYLHAWCGEHTEASDGVER